jgi:hypothetical protein
MQAGTIEDLRARLLAAEQEVNECANQNARIDQLAEQCGKLRLRVKELEAKLAEHMIMFRSNDETIAKLRQELQRRA